MNETKFIKELRQSFVNSAVRNNRETPLTWKLRGSASTAGRPDLIIIDRGKTFFIETKVCTLKQNIDLMSLLSPLQRVNLELIIAAGGNAFLVVLLRDRYAIAVKLHEMTMFSDLLPETLHVCSLEEFDPFYIPDTSFLLTKVKGQWHGVEHFALACK